MEMKKHFIGEAIEPAAETLDNRRMARGEPGLPKRFRWRGEEHEVAEVLESWRQTGPCTSGSDEQYVRKHWYRIRTTAGAEMTLYFDRQARSARERKTRWWLHSASMAEEKDP